MADKVDPRRKLHDLLKKVDNAMLVTRREDEALHARPMRIAAVDDDCTIWFFTSRSSPKVAELDGDADVQVTSQEGGMFLAIGGTARIVDDKAKIDELWSKPYEVWFPDGKDDPELCLVAVTPTEGEYWDQHGVSRLRYLVEAARAFVEGRRPHVATEEHAKTPLQ